MSDETALGGAVPATVAASKARDGAEAKPHAHLGRRNDRLLLLAVAVYAILLSFLMIARGILLTPDVVAVGFGLVADRKSVV